MSVTAHRIRGMRATSIRLIGDGKAFWYGLAETSAGPMFVKVPFAQPSGGHESAWQEYVALRLARAVGIPALEPHPVEVPPTLVTDSDRARTFWDFGNIFAGTPYQQKLAPGRGYEELGNTGKALLYIFDNVLYYVDRARPTVPQSRQDRWLSDDGKPILFDWDNYAAPSRTSGVGMAVATYTWEASKFLGVQLCTADVKRACESVVAGLSDILVREAVGSAAAIWARVDETAVANWLLGRRDNVLPAFVNTQSPSWAL